MDKNPLVHFSQLAYYRNNKQIFSKLTGEIFTGEIISLLGANGSGKTTLLSIIAGQLPNHSGNIYFNESLKYQLSLGYMPDNPPLFPNWTVQELLIRLTKIRKVDIERLYYVLKICQLEKVLSQKIQHLSYGYQRRINLAQTILHQPTILLLDEPMNGLDFDQQLLLNNTIKQLASNQTAIILSVHDLVTALNISDKIWYLDSNKLKIYNVEKGNYYYGEFSQIQNKYQGEIISKKVIKFTPKQYQQQADLIAKDQFFLQISQQIPAQVLQHWINND